MSRPCAFGACELTAAVNNDSRHCDAT